MQLKRMTVVAGLLLGSASSAADAAFIVDIEQIGSDVVASGNGSINTRGLSLFGFTTGTSQGYVAPRSPGIAVGSGSWYAYRGSFSGPANLGPGSAVITASFSTGLCAGLNNSGGTGSVVVPYMYVSGSNLSSSATFSNMSLSDLGLSVGNYMFKFGSGMNVDTFTINVLSPMSPVPLPASAPMFGAALLVFGLAGYGVNRKMAAAAA